MSAGVIWDDGWRRTNLGHLLFSATGASIGDKLRIVRAAGFLEITDAYLQLFESLETGGARLTALATRAGLTKQSMIEIVDRAEGAGMVERRPDPVDRRAKVVHLTKAGHDLRALAEHGLAEAENNFARAVGPAAMPMIRGVLGSYAGNRRHGRHIEHLLAAAAERFVRSVLDAVHQYGYAEVTEALLALFRTLELGGSRLTDLAAAARITKQSMRVLVERAEALGLVEREASPDDGRAKTIRFSRPGLVMLEEMRLGVAAAERDFVGLTNDASLVRLKLALKAYLARPPSVAASPSDSFGQPARHELLGAPATETSPAIYRQDAAGHRAARHERGGGERKIR